MVEVGLGDLFANLWKLISHIKTSISGLRLLSNCASKSLISSFR